MKRQELLSSPAYWTQQIQLSLFNELNRYLKEGNISRTDFAKQLGVTKGYVSQILNGDFDHKLSKLVELSLACGVVPLVSFQPIEEYMQAERVRLTVPKWQAVDFTEQKVITTNKSKISQAFTTMPVDEHIFKVA